MNERRRKRLRMISAVMGLSLILFLLLVILQHFWAHRWEKFVPDYPQAALNENSDYETIFLQTGLGRDAVNKLRTEGEFQKILDAQELFFQPQETECMPLLSWFTREDRIVEGAGTELVDVQPGDIIVTLSTHSIGWRHGHAGLIIDESTVLECGVLGKDSALKDIAHWTTYSNYAVLRVRNVTPKQQELVKEFALDKLLDVPYQLLAGFIGPKAMEQDAPYFGLQCAYLVWYAWNEMGYDLDCDGGRLVSASDLLHSDCVEVVQVYGMDLKIKES